MGPRLTFGGGGIGDVIFGILDGDVDHVFGNGDNRGGDKTFGAFDNLLDGIEQLFAENGFLGWWLPGRSCGMFSINSRLEF